MNRKILTAAAALLMCGLAAAPAFADMGPKDQLTVYVENAPDEEYYLDLLYQPSDPTSESEPYDNLQSDSHDYDETMTAALCAYEDEGWYPAYVYGTGAPMWGSLVGNEKNGRMVHTFGYFGLPDTYRIIIVTKSGASFVSDTYTRASLQSAVTVDYGAKTVDVPSPAAQYAAQFLGTCIPTLIIEGLLLALFGYLKKDIRRRNFLTFLAVNVATQIALSATLGTMMIRSSVVGVFFFLIPAEIVVAAVEAIIYAYALRGYRKRRAVIYAVAANACSCAFGFLSLYKLAEFVYSL